MTHYNKGVAQKFEDKRTRDRLSLRLLLPRTFQKCYQFEDSGIQIFCLFLIEVNFRN